MVSLLRIISPDPGKASVLSTNISVSFAETSLTRPVRKLAPELYACLALVLRLRLTNLVKIIFGGAVYPLPGSVTTISLIEP